MDEAQKSTKINVMYQRQSSSNLPFSYISFLKFLFIPAQHLKNQIEVLLIWSPQSYHAPCYYQSFSTNWCTRKVL